MSKFETILGGYQDIRLSGGGVSGSQNIRDKNFLLFPLISLSLVSCILIVCSPDTLWVLGCDRISSIKTGI